MDARDLEVRCAGCDAGFAAGTRRCIHCGLALGGRGPQIFAPPADAGAEPAEESAQLSSLLSGGVMLAVVVASALIRACS